MDETFPCDALMPVCPVHGVSAQPYSARRLRRVRKPAQLNLLPAPFTGLAEWLKPDDW
jgi:hypothetical protein